jgi:hypothetical protein
MGDDVKRTSCLRARPGLRQPTQNSKSELRNRLGLNNRLLASNNGHVWQRCGRWLNRFLSGGFDKKTTEKEMKESDHRW